MSITKIEACGGVVLRVIAGNPEVLVIFRRGYWDLPKGKREDAESLEECAVREVAEETGLSGIHIIQELGTTEHRYNEQGVTIHKTTYWYLMTADVESELTPQAEEDIERVDWMDFSEAFKRVGFQNLKVVLDRVRVHLPS